ncbi:DUF4157 domain-containing protein [Paraburkholderia sp. MM5482-R1]|uniref:eCIS core domain-containing protein n=1 Tax=unclassified Paraburkholderia TaxID=2615204 RepID=UPI003D221991
MFSSKVTKPQTEIAGGSSNGLKRERPGLTEQHHGSVKQALLLQRNIGNQATLQLMAKRTRRPTAETSSRDHRQELAPQNTPVRAVPCDGSSDFRGAPSFPPDRARRLRSSSPLSAFRQPSVIQRKLVIGAFDDPLEHEADLVADRVMGLPKPRPPISAAPRDINRKCSTCEEEEKAETVQRKPSLAAAASTREAPAGVEQALRSSGHPLDIYTRTHFEDRFGYDFSSVRVHTDAGAAASAASIGAAAYTAGADIVFGAGRYQPATSAGRRLLAHELTHVVQQSSSNRLSVSLQSSIVRCQVDSDEFKRGYGDALKGDIPHPGPLNVDGLADYDRGYEKGRDEYMAGPVAAPGPSQPGAVVGTPARCTTMFSKARSFQELIDLVRAAEAALVTSGITSPKDQIHALRGLFYGTLWSLDYSVEQSTTRNEGFQRFTRPSEANVAMSTPPDVRSALGCGLSDALKNSQDMTDPSGRQVDFGHLIIGLDARGDPALSTNLKHSVPVPVVGSIDVELGGTGTELVTWLGDLGGGAASLAIRRVAAPTVSVSAVFSGSDYGGSINLEGDVAASVVATSNTTAVTAPNIAAGKKLSDVLQDYLSPAAPTATWTTRARAFLTMNGGMVDPSGALTNRAALIALFAPKIQTFACAYLASRVKDKHISFGQAKAAANHVIPCAQEVATAFVDALDYSSRTGGKIEATRFPAASPASPGACTTLIYAGGAASTLGL